MRKIIFVKDAGSLYRVFLDEVLYVESLKDYVTLNMINGKRHIVHGTMNYAENKLRTFNFLRASRTHLVNMEKIDVIVPNFVVIGDRHIAIGNRHKATFLTEIEKFRL